MFHSFYQTCTSLCLINFLFISFTTHSQFLIYPDSPDGRRYRIDLDRSILESETKAESWQTLGPVQLQKVDLRDFPPSTRAIMLSTRDQHIRYLLVDCTNQVYRFDTRSRILERIDKTYFRGHNCYSSRFLRRDTLYSFGGYGYWHTNNILTYYKPDAGEWESIIPQNDGPESMYRGIGGYLPGHDVFILGLSHHENDSEHQGKFRYDWNVWFYQFATRSWQEVGEVSQVVRAVLNVDLEKETDAVQVGQYFMLSHCTDKPVKLIYLFDPIGNAVYEWQDTDKRVGCLNFHSEGDVPPAYVFADTIHYFFATETTTGGNRLEKRRLPLNQVRKQARYIGTFYVPLKEPTNGWLVGLFVGLAGLVAALIWWFRKRNPGIAVLTEDLAERASNPDMNRLDGLERSLLQALLDAHNKGGVSSEQLTDVLSIGARTPENQRRIRSEVINGLSTKLHLVIGIENAILRRQADDDRRIAVYQLRPEAYQKLASSLPPPPAN